ncbi:dihydrofolate reductase [Sneathia sanguinegens]|uniref:dihydrofolate reductase n=1 Tax=Sneathia sanguinegens TaxID=40543 RepID=UPI002889F850|nr:dihydrofolate reductase [Sneathia sanguinegens]
MLKIIVAIGKNREIGKDNKLLWHLPEDLKHFKNLTKNSTVIMGYNTYLSIGRPLPNRKNIVLCDKVLNIKGVEVYNNLEKCLKENNDAYIIGGQSIYEQTLKYVTELHISYIDKEFKDADTFFPAFEKSFKLKYREAKEGFEYRVYEKME